MVISGFHMYGLPVCQLGRVLQWPSSAYADERRVGEAMLAMPFVAKSMEISYVGLAYEFIDRITLISQTYNPQE